MLMKPLLSMATSIMLDRMNKVYHGQKHLLPNSSLYNLVIVFLKVLMLRKGGLIDLLSARFL